MEGDEREALDIILQNPAILQCGKSLSNQRADEIKSFARMLASFADRVPPQISQGILVLVLGTVLLNIVLSKSDDPAVLDLLMVLKPLLGGTFALAFLGTISMVGMGEAAASRAKRSKKEGRKAGGHKRPAARRRREGQRPHGWSAAEQRGEREERGATAASRGQRREDGRETSQRPWRASG